MEKRNEKIVISYWLQNWDKHIFRSINGKEIKILFPGFYSNIGPDFQNAIIRAGKRIIRGDIEFHYSSKDWFIHDHHNNPEFNNVICHFVYRTNHSNYRIETNNKKRIYTCKINIPEKLMNNVTEKIETGFYLPCYQFNLRKETKTKVYKIIKMYAVKWLKYKITHVRNICGKPLSSFIKIYHLLKKSNTKNHLINNYLNKILLFSLAESMGFNNNKSNFINWMKQVYPYYIKNKCKNNFIKIYNTIKWTNKLFRPNNSPLKRINQLYNFLESCNHEPLSKFILDIKNNKVLNGVINHNLLKSFGNNTRDLIFVNIFLIILIIISYIDKNRTLFYKSIRTFNKIKINQSNFRSRFIETHLFNGKIPPEYKNSLLFHGIIYIHKNFCTKSKCPTCPLIKELNKKPTTKN